MPKFPIGSGKFPTQSMFPLFTFEEIVTPGAYLEVETGRLFRIQPPVFQPGHSPMLSITSTDIKRYARLSEDPNVPISKARVLAADGDFFTAF